MRRTHQRNTPVKRRIVQQMTDDAILKMPRLVERYETYKVYSYKDYSINIHKTREDESTKLLCVWSPSSLTIQLHSTENEKSLLELAVFWIDRHLANQLKRKRK